MNRKKRTREERETVDHFVQEKQRRQKQDNQTYLTDQRRFYAFEGKNEGKRNGKGRVGVEKKKRKTRVRKTKRWNESFSIRKTFLFGISLFPPSSFFAAL